MEKRLLHRTNDSLVIYALDFELKLGHDLIETKVKNYHFRGACLELIDMDFADKLLAGDASAFTLSMKLGNRMIKDEIPFRIVWQRLGVTGEFGIEFVTIAKDQQPRSGRITSHDHIKPNFSAADPLDPNRKLYLTVENLSDGGFLLSSALTNRHLFAGMKLLGGKLALPGEAEMPVDGEIVHTRVAEGGQRFYIGCKINGDAKEFVRGVRRYALFLADLSTDLSARRKDNLPLGLLGLKEKRVKSGLTFRVVSNDADYADTLALRYLAYDEATELQQGVTKEDLGGSSIDEAVIVVGYLSGKAVCSVEMRSPKLGHESWIVSLLRGAEKAEYLARDFVEVGRLVIHPDFQRTDILLGLYEKVLAFCMAQGLPDILLVAAPNVANLYKKLGVQFSGHTVAHPFIKDEVLHVMVATAKNYAQGEGMSLFTKQILFKTLETYYADRQTQLKYKISYFEKKLSEAVFAAFPLVKKAKRYLNRQSRRLVRV